MDAGPILLTIIVLLFVIGTLSIVISMIYDNDYVTEKRQIVSSSHRDHRSSEATIIIDDDDDDQEYGVVIDDL